MRVVFRLEEKEVLEISKAVKIMVMHEVIALMLAFGQNKFFA